MKNLLTTIGLTSVLLIASSAQADISEEDYNPHANNHVSYTKAHSANEMPKASMKMKMTSITDDVNNDNPYYNPNPQIENTMIAQAFDSIEHPKNTRLTYG